MIGFDSSIAGKRWVQIGALSSQTSNSTGEVFLQGSIDDPSLPEPLSIALFGTDGEGYRVACLQHDPCCNVDAAKWIFLTALHDTKDVWRAVGAYHSPTRWRRIRDARSVSVIMARDGP